MCSAAACTCASGWYRLGRHCSTPVKSKVLIILSAHVKAGDFVRVTHMGKAQLRIQVSLALAHWLELPPLVEVDVETRSVTVEWASEPRNGQ